MNFVKEEYEEWLTTYPCLAGTIPQAALFALVTTRLAGAGVSLNDMIKTVCRAHGFRVDEVEINTDGC